MSIRKRRWKARNGETKEAWVVDYIDGAGVRRLKTFKRKHEADDFETVTRSQLRDGVHVADRASTTVAEAGKLWIRTAIDAGRERTTTDQYQQHLDLHIVPFIGKVLLTKQNVPTVRAFEDALRSGVPGDPDPRCNAPRSPAMVRKVLSSLGSLFADAQERGLIARNPVRELRRRRDRRPADRQRKKLQIGVDIPSPAEIKILIGGLSERWRPILLTAIFTGLRSSELRGLRWADIDLASNRLHVRQRADRHRNTGAPKSEAGNRTVPLTPIVANTLREWKLRCPKGPKDLVFPSGAGNVESHANIVQRGLIAAQHATGLTIDTEQRDDTGQPIAAAKYTGLHSLRHFYASWCINRVKDGGLGLTPKIVQERLGHAHITMTMDTYGHLFPQEDDSELLAAAERSLLGT
jgi:integrase